MIGGDADEAVDGHPRSAAADIEEVHKKNGTKRRRRGQQSGGPRLACPLRT
jgi:hypothetical protein